MNILHVTPHLGGGVGKAHAALCAALPDDVQQTFLLLEEPRDRRYADAIVSCGAQVRIARNLDEVAQCARAADIVQFEFWNHPRLFECLARVDFPAIRSVFWSHVSGLFKPVIPAGLMKEAGRFAFTTEASLAIPSLAELPPRKVAAINSGFGFVNSLPCLHNGVPRIAYLGTVDFVKMNPVFFDAVDALGGNIHVSIWGSCDPAGAVAARARAMNHPRRVRFHGHTDNPAHALAEADIFFYPLQPDHYGTAENALVEAMSLGLIPVVLDNPAETAIVRHDENGLVAGSSGECVALLQRLFASPDLRRRLSRNAVRTAAAKSPAHSAQAFTTLWTALVAEAPQRPDFRSAVGGAPADWFLATQRLPGANWAPSIVPEPARSKGTLAHFETVFTGDDSLARLRADMPA